MNQIVSEQIARKALNRFLTTILDEEYGLIGPTENLAQVVLYQVTEITSFFNVIPAHEVTQGGMVEVEPGVRRWIPPTVKKYPKSKKPFRWSVVLRNGHRYIADEHGARLITKNFWLDIVDHWSIPGYASLRFTPQGWAIYEGGSK